MPSRVCINHSARRLLQLLLAIKLHSELRSCAPDIHKHTHSLSLSQLLSRSNLDLYAVSLRTPTHTLTLDPTESERHIWWYYLSLNLFHTCFVLPLVMKLAARILFILLSPSLSPMFLFPLPLHLCLLILLLLFLHQLQLEISLGMLLPSTHWCGMRPRYYAVASISIRPFPRECRRAREKVSERERERVTRSQLASNALAIALHFFHSLSLSHPLSSSLAFLLSFSLPLLYVRWINVYFCTSAPKIDFVLSLELYPFILSTMHSLCFYLLCSVESTWTHEFHPLPLPLSCTGAILNL